MDYMNVYYVPVAQQVVHPIGGILISIWDLLFLCKVIDGLLIQEMSTLKKD